MAALPGRSQCVRDMIQHLFSMGLSNPNEKTLGTMSALLGYKKFRSMEISLQSTWLEHHLEMKQHVQGCLDRLRKANASPAGAHIVNLPHSLEELPTLAVFDTEKPSPSKISLDTLAHMIAIYPLRRAKGFVPTTSPQPAMSSQPSGIDLAMANLFGVGMQHMSSSMDWLRSMHARAQGPASVQLPGLQMLTPPSFTPCPNGDRAERPRDGMLLALQDGSVSTSVAAPELPKQEPLTLDSGLGQTQKQPENYGALVVASPADCANAPIQAQVKDEKGKQGSQAALGQQKGGLEALSTLQNALQDREREKEKVMKKPASAGCGVKGSGKKGTSMKKPASAAKKTKPTKAMKQDKPKKGIITEKMRMKLMPEGCSKCRYRKGCTNSCWLGRGYQLA